MEDKKKAKNEILMSGIDEGFLNYIRPKDPYEFINKKT
jgi:hypothetical protein